MRQTLYDFQRRIVAERFQVAGEQFGALAAAMGEPAPMEFADKVLWCVTSENWQQSVAAFQHILETVPGWENKINVVWIGPHAPELNQPVRRNFKLSFRNASGKTKPRTGQRLRTGHPPTSGVRIGLALGGGAARGMAHLGIL